MELKPLKIDDLTPETYKAVMERSMEDISSIYEDVPGKHDQYKGQRI